MPIPPTPSRLITYNEIVRECSSTGEWANTVPHNRLHLGYDIEAATDEVKQTFLKEFNQVDKFFSKQKLPSGYQLKANCESVANDHAMFKTIQLTLWTCSLR